MFMLFSSNLDVVPLIQGICVRLLFISFQFYYDSFYIAIDLVRVPALPYCSIDQLVF